MNDTMIETRGLTKDYGGKGVFDLNLAVHAGECYGYLGPQRGGQDHHAAAADGLYPARRRHGAHCRAGLL